MKRLMNLRLIVIDGVILQKKDASIEAIFGKWWQGTDYMYIDY